MNNILAQEDHYYKEFEEQITKQKEIRKDAHKNAENMYDPVNMSQRASFLNATNRKSQISANTAKSGGKNFMKKMKDVLLTLPNSQGANGEAIPLEKMLQGTSLEEQQKIERAKVHIRYHYQKFMKRIQADK